MTDLCMFLQNRGLSPRKTSLNHGGEFCCSCPVCGDGGKGADSNRFHVWPLRENGGKGLGRFWCRQCGISGDTIAYLQQIDGLSFPQACAELGIPLDRPGKTPESRFQSTPITPKVAAPVWVPRTYPDPDQLWQQKAANLLADCQARLLADAEAMAWLAHRGIDGDMVRVYGLGYNQSSKGKDRYRPRSVWGLPSKTQNGQEKRLWLPRGWVIPAWNTDGHIIQLRIRRRNDDINAFASDIKYLPIDGSSMATMVLHPEAEVFVVVESGFDAVLLAALSDGKIGAVTTWNSAARPDALTHARLSRASLILGGLDYDQGGDREQPWWQQQYRQYRRLPALHGGAKDPGDAAQAGANLHSWLISGLPRGLQIKLGFISGRNAIRNPGKAVAPAPALPPDPVGQVDEGSAADLVEIELVSGTVVYVTNDQQQWQLLARQGKPVFSQHELSRLQQAIAGLGGDERTEAIMRVIEAKELFGGYVCRGVVG